MTKPIKQNLNFSSLYWTLSYEEGFYINIYLCIFRLYRKHSLKLQKQVNKISSNLVFKVKDWEDVLF